MSPIKTINIKIALEKKALLLLLSKKLSQYLSCNEIICRITLPLRWILKEKKLYGPFLWMGLNCLQAIEPLRRDSLLFITKSPEVPGTHLIDPGTHLIDLGRMKGWVDLGATQWFWTRKPWIGNPVPYASVRNELSLIVGYIMHWLNYTKDKSRSCRK